MTKALAHVIAVGALALGAALALPAAVASADVVTPANTCTASGQWVQAGFTKNSADLSPNDVVLVPQKDTVNWQGHEFGKPIGYVGPPRAIDGAVQLHLPFGINVTIWHWTGDKSQRYSNEGQEKYNVPSALIGVKLKLSGFHNEGGRRVCTGSVYVEVAGSKTKNPVAWAGIGGSVIFAAGMLTAGFRKTRPAYDDINP